jgi:hypothetical protein
MKGHHMTTAEQLLAARRRRQILNDDEAGSQHVAETLQREDAWMKGFMDRLAVAIRNIGSRR